MIASDDLFDRMTSLELIIPKRNGSPGVCKFESQKRMAERSPSIERDKPLIMDNLLTAVVDDQEKIC